jgi:hypothetical protein
MDHSEYLPKLAKAPIGSNSKADGKSTTYSIPLFWNLIEKISSKDDHRLDQNPKK